MGKEVRNLCQISARVVEYQTLGRRKDELCPEDRTVIISLPVQETERGAGCILMMCRQERECVVGSENRTNVSYNFNVMGLPRKLAGHTV